MTESTESVEQKYIRIMDQVTASAAHCGRSEHSVKLIVVTKGQPSEKMARAYAAGARLFGENYPEETAGKLEALRSLSGIQLHMIGHLQSRKAKIVSNEFQYMHSIDRVSIAEKLDRELNASGKKLPILLEMNVSGEDSKNGFPAWDQTAWADLLPLVNEIASYGSLVISGLMTMPPLSLDREAVRPYFKKLRDLRDYFAVQFPLQTWTELSMGTSSDFETAIQEGATYIRVGTAIMGLRPPKPTN
ncbi:MAG: YggS family pyridoxal phosphate-dependent enzyme [Leptolinea sp.]|nr:YggS family pyridoxal phosphate-dependent enzyme [Leptolinea sp.]